MDTAQASRSRDVASIVERYFQVSLFLLIAAAFLTLVGTNRLDLGSSVLVCGALALRGYFLAKKRDVRIPERWTTYLTLIYVLVFVIDLLLLSGSYVSASVHLVLFSLVVKLFSVQRERDYIYLAILAFLAVLAASVLTVDTLFLASFVVFILLAVNTFISMEVRRSLKQAHYSGPPVALSDEETRLSLSLSTFSLLIVIGIVIGSAAIFFVLPRFSAGYLRSFASQNQLVTGFSDQVSLGEIGRIKQTDSVVMHVQVENARTFDLKWRGVALTVFDGRTWKNQATQHDFLESYVGRYSLREAQLRRRNLRSMPDNPGDFRLVHYKVVMEPIGTNVIFLPFAPIELAGRFHQISIDETGSILNTDTSRMTESYEGLSQVPSYSPAILNAASGDYPPEIAMMYLQLPVLDPRIHELAVKIVGSASSDYEKAAAIERYLRENYGYTLNLGNSVPSDPLAYFLFERKQGHCEYFASSMAVMLRSIGIPARIVNGFRTGEFNDLTDSYIIRARDAHSWVEAYLPSVGWTSFDPTPADPQPAQNTFSRLRLYLDAAQAFWREWIINYDFSHQRQLTETTVVKAQHSAYDLRRWWRQHYDALIKRAQRINDSATEHPRSTVVFVTSTLAFLILIWNLRRILRFLRQRSIAREPAKSPQKAASIWYTRMVKAVARRGYPKQKTQTPHEFIKAIPESSLRASVEKFTERYERARFGDSPSDAEQLPTLYEEIAERK